MDKMREEFEVWCASIGFTLKPNAFDNGDYAVGYGWEEWNAWQASRAALVVELPTLENGLIHPYDGVSMVVDAVARQLDLAGVGYK